MRGRRRTWDQERLRAELGQSKSCSQLPAQNPTHPNKDFFSKIALKLKKSKKSASFQIITKIIPVERARSCPLNGWQAMPPLGQEFFYPKYFFKKKTLSPYSQLNVSPTVLPPFNILKTSSFLFFLKQFKRCTLSP